jgi:hypothetical protein
MIAEEFKMANQAEIRLARSTEVRFLFFRQSFRCVLSANEGIIDSGRQFLSENAPVMDADLEGLLLKNSNHVRKGIQELELKGSPSAACFTAIARS